MQQEGYDDGLKPLLNQPGLKKGEEGTIGIRGAAEGTLPDVITLENQGTLPMVPAVAVAETVAAK